MMARQGEIQPMWKEPQTGKVSLNELRHHAFPAKQTSGNLLKQEAERD